MQTSKKSIGAVIGRFSMVHNQHERMFQQMAKENSHVLIMLGSSNRCISPKNPFSFEQRASFVLSVIAQFMEPANVRIVPLPDRIYTEGRWEAKVQQAVDSYAEELEVTDSRIAMYGNEKDHTGYWQRNFPQWKRVDIGLHEMIHATDLRNIWFNVSQILPVNGDTLVHRLAGSLPEPMREYLRNVHVFNPELQSDWNEYKREEQKFVNYPYRNGEDHLNVMCGDAVVECAGHILTVTRNASPGKGIKALPGGHKKAWETSTECSLRELLEETNLRIPLRVLRNCIRGKNLFDHPARNVGSVSRSTTGIHIKLEPREDGSLPRAKGGDDAKNDHLPNGGCEWVKIDDILSGKVILFDDHSDIVDFFVK